MTMKEIGGYIELEHNHGHRWHEDALALNCGRNALAYLCKARGIRKMRIPRFLCECVDHLLDKIGVAWTSYAIGEDFLPAQRMTLEDGEWLYLVNYYGQVSRPTIAQLKVQYDRLIVDNCQSYFSLPARGVDTLYTCRKFFGVPDGAFLYTDAPELDELERDVSFERMRYLLGRVERPASEFYAEYVQRNEDFAKEPVKRMSLLTENLLRGIDYARVCEARNLNYGRLSERLGEFNQLMLSEEAPFAPFAYPLLVPNGRSMRLRLIEMKIYVPTLWPAVLERCAPDSLEYQFASNILPLPVDQRYSVSDMDVICDAVLAALK